MKGLSIKYHLSLGLLIVAICLYGQVKPDDKLFSLLTSKHTGIDFNNAIKDKPEHNILLYANYYGGAGVGVGDFDRDGLPDLFFAGNLVEDRIYLNLGDFRFEDISEKALPPDAGGWSSGVIVGDVNGDGWDDIYVTRELYDDQPERRANKLYLNNKDLSFSDASTSWGAADTSRTRHATFLDYDNDGDLDLFLLNQPPNPGSYSKFKDADLSADQYSPRLLQNTGARFVDVTKQAGVLKSGYPNSVIAADLDQDGFTDLYVGNDFEAPDFYYRNNGDGTFTDILSSSTGHTSFYSMGVDAADINNDGWLDVMVLDMVAEDNYRLKANMSGMDPAAFWKVVRDGGHYQYMFNTLLLNQGGKVLSDIAQHAGVAATDWSWSNLMVDLDNDGLKDIYVTNGLVRDIRNTDAQKAFVKHVVAKTTAYIKEHPEDSSITVFDLIDLEAALSIIPSQKLSNYAFKNQGDFSFEKMSDTWGLDQKGFSNGSAYADLNNDGFLDLIVSNINDEAFIYKNNGSSSQSNNYLRIRLQDPGGATVLGSRISVRIGDVEQSEVITSVRGMYSTSEHIAHFGLGKSHIANEITIRWPDGQVDRLQEVAGNNLLTLQKKSNQNPSANAKSGISTLFEDSPGNLGLDFKHKENYFDDYRFQVLLPHKQSQYGPAVAVGDVNGDALDDVFVGGASGQASTLYIQTPNGTFTEVANQPWQFHSIMEDVAATFFDVDGDGDQDLFVGSGGNEFAVGHPFYQDRLYLNNGDGNFQHAPDLLPSFPISTGTVLPFDFDLDGDLDVFVGARFIPRDYPAPASSYLLENKGGTLADVTDAKAAVLRNIGLITDAATVDLDENGLPDLILTGEWMSPRILINTKEEFRDETVSYGLDQLNGWWYNVTTGDFDQDGDLDFVFGNLGLNYKYKASETEPFEVFYNDFDENGSRDIVLSYYNQGNQFPVRGKSCSTQQVPSLAKKFDSYDLFASSGLEEIYTPAKLELGLQLQATTFGSMYGENRGGTIKTKTLPGQAQFAPINDAAVGDFNADGHLDLLYGGNLFVSEVETTRADGGIGGILVGDGKGNFKALPATKSGIYVHKDIRQIREIKVKGNSVILFASNNDRLTLLTKNHE